MFPNHRFSFAVTFLACLLGAFALFGCASPGTQTNLAQVQQVVSSFCPMVNTDLQVLSTSPTVPAPLQEKFKTMLTINQGVCAAGTGITATDLQTLNTQVVQVAIGILLANPAIPNQPVILLALQLGQPLVTQAIAQLQATTPAATVAAPAVAVPESVAPAK